MQHIKIMHEELVKPCRFFKQGSCMFTEDMCWYSHKLDVNINKTSRNEFQCKYCENTFLSKSELMKHRKLKHIQHIATCRYKTNNKCKHKDECWYNHEPTETKQRNIDNLEYSIDY